LPIGGAHPFYTHWKMAPMIRYLAGAALALAVVGIVIIVLGVTTLMHGVGV